MAAEAPTPKTLKSWEDAFQYTVPVVRRMEQQLRSDVSSNKERLRTLVGGSYRDLLSTADSIIEMDSQMQQVESYLATMGMKCNARLLERSSVNLSRLNKTAQLKDRTHYGAASQLSILRACPTVISRLLRKKGSVLLAAKVLVISRLLHKKLSEGNAHQDKTLYIERIRSKLAKLRQKLLSSIDATFGSADAGQSVLVEAMCAFALATSSSARDVLRHFHQLRVEAIVSHMRHRQSGNGADFMLDAMKLWIRSIQETHAVFPRQLSSAMMSIKAVPLFSGDDVRDIAELDQEVHGAWIGEDIRNFTPYIRHDDLDAEAMKKLLGAWAPMALGRYLDSVHPLLESIKDYEAVTQLRKRVLDLLFQSRSRVTGIDRSQVIKSLRDAFKERLLNIARERCSTLATVAQMIQSTLQAWEIDPPKYSSDLWDKSLISLDTSHGAPMFIDALRSRLHGTSSTSKSISQQHQAWLRNVQDFEDVVENMRATKWDEDDDDLAVDLDEDEDEFSARHDMLSVTDPQELSEGLETSARDAASGLQSMMDETVQTLKDPESAAKAAFLLRLLRDALGTSPTDVKVSLPAIYCSPDSLTRLYDVLATHTIHSSLHACRPAIMKFLARHDLPQRALWEGNPELPVLPSPWTFRVLQSLVKEMGNLGVDVWAKGAVEKVKTAMRRETGVLLSDGLEERTSEGEILVEGGNGGDDAVGDDADEKMEKKNLDAEDNSDVPSSKPKAPAKETPVTPSKDLLIQLTFDMAYLLQATSPPPSKSSSHATSPPLANDAATSKLEARADTLSSIYDKLLSDLSLDAWEKRRILTAAAEYWKRTSLLFALLG